ncbi:MAG: methionyl-tRNA formyltransferase, partial [Bacilli bacterium]|nr:methionyl-tRNA formyltransferase [Bacilli bacterium]
MERFHDIVEARIVYMGTPEISAEVFSMLIEAGFHFVAAITNEDKPVGRKRILEPTPVKKVALEHNIPVFQPHRIRTDNAFLKDIPCDLILTMAYGQIVPDEVLRHPRFG